MIEWKRSEEGYVDSKCGHWKIIPQFFSCVRPRSFELKRDGKHQGSFETQKAAKEGAERYSKTTP